MSGFFVHAFFFPDFFYDGISSFQKSSSKIVPTVAPQVEDNSQKIQFFTYINYDGQKFDKRNVIIRLGNYLVVTNTSSSEGMLLESDLPIFNTGRPFGLSETVQSRLDIPGMYYIHNTLKPSATINVIVR